MATLITIEDLKIFHTIDRRIFSRLVIDLARAPAESLLVMALWLWLEDLDFVCIVDKMVEFSDSLVNGLANEAVLFLKCLESRAGAGTVVAAGGGGEGGGEEDDMPLTSLVAGKAVSSGRFYAGKFAAISGIKSFLNKVCAVVFADILHQVLSGISVSLSISLSQDSPIPIPGFPHPTFGAITVIPRTPDYVIPDGGLWGWSTSTEAAVDDRTMFLTFSRGYPVTEEEVKELFNSHYGDCVETVKMVPPTVASEQPLYARLVVRSVSTIDQVLCRGPIAKFRVNGKHVWARKYERRDVDLTK